MWRCRLDSAGSGQGLVACCCASHHIYQMGTRGVKRPDHEEDHASSYFWVSYSWICIIRVSSNKQTNKRILIHVWDRSVGTVTEYGLYDRNAWSYATTPSAVALFAAPLAPEVCVADRRALVKFPRSVELPASVWVSDKGQGLDGRTARYYTPPVTWKSIIVCTVHIRAQKRYQKQALPSPFPCYCQLRVSTNTDANTKQSEIKMSRNVSRYIGLSGTKSDEVRTVF
jgi:hypothetical protein